MRVLPRYFLIKISKALMNEKRKLPGGLVVPDTDESGEYSLGYGEIVQIGEKANKDYEFKSDGETIKVVGFEEAEVGDTIFLHHWVEQSTNRVNEDDEFIYIALLDDGHDIKGVEKPDGTIIPHPKNIWCKLLPEKKHSGPLLEEQDGKWKVGEHGFFVFDGDFEDENYLRDKLEKIEFHSKYMADAHSSNTTPNEIIAAKIQANQKEGEKITQKLNEKKVWEFEVFAINRKTAEFFPLTPGDHLFAEGWIEKAGYDFTYKGQTYWLIKESSALLGLKKEFV